MNSLNQTLSLLSIAKPCVALLAVGIVHSVIVLVPGTSLPILLPLTSAKKTFPLPSVDSAVGWLLAVGIVHSSIVTES